MFDQIHHLFLALLLCVSVAHCSVLPTGAFPIFLNSFQNGSVAKWSTPCFGSVVASATFFDDGFRIDVVLAQKNRTDVGCSDNYLFADVEQIYVLIFDQTGKESIFIPWNGNQSLELKDVNERGLETFLIQDGVVEWVYDMWDLAHILLEGLDKETLIEFMSENAGFDYIKRDQLYVDFKKEDVQSGDVVVFSGWLALTLLIEYGTGSRIDHSTVAAWIDDELYIIESSAGGVHKTRWDDRMPHGDSSQMIGILRLKDEYYQKLNVTKAYEWFQTVEGLSYGYSNFIFGWIDTPKDNYPPQLTEEFFLIVMGLLDRLYSKEVAEIYFLPGLNHRLGTTGLNMQQIMQVAGDRGISYGELMSIVEEDDWIYGKGPAMVCSAFVTRFFKEGGLFGDLNIQGNEFTPKDLYQLAIFDKDWKKPVYCQDDIPFCQINGPYLLDLKGYSTIEPYDHMNQKCGSVPPVYGRHPNKC